jgi:hypothetical protein
VSQPLAKLSAASRGPLRSGRHAFEVNQAPQALARRKSQEVSMREI